MGPQDAQRFDSLEREERDFLSFEADFTMAVLRKRPYHFEALQAAANSLTALGYFEDGLTYDERLCEMRPTDPLIVYNLACSLSLVNKQDEALDRLEQAITLGYNDRKHLKDDPDLENIRELPRFEELLSHIKHF